MDQDDRVLQGEGPKQSCSGAACCCSWSCDAATTVERCKNQIKVSIRSVELGLQARLYLVETYNKYCMLLYARSVRTWILETDR